MRIKLNLTVNDQQIELVREQKYLGLLIQHDLKWNKQVSKIKRSIDCVDGSLHRLGNETNIFSRKQIYYLKVHTHLTAMLPIFGANLHFREVDTLQRTQDKVVKRLFGRDSDGQQATDALYKEYDIMKVDQLIRFYSALLHRKMEIDFRTFERGAFYFRNPLDFKSPVGVRDDLLEQYNSFDESITDIDNFNEFKHTLKRNILGYEV